MTSTCWSRSQVASQSLEPEPRKRSPGHRETKERQGGEGWGSGEEQRRARKPGREVV